MKKLFTLFVFLTLSVCCIAGPIVPAPATPRPIVDDSGNYLSSSHPAPVIMSTGTSVIGKVSIDQTTDGTTNAVHLVAGTAKVGSVTIVLPLTASTTSKVVTNTAATIVSVANRESIKIWNNGSETVYVSLGTVTATLNDIPIYAYGSEQFDIPDTIAMGIICATGPVNIVKCQLGR